MFCTYYYYYYYYYYYPTIANPCFLLLIILKATKTTSKVVVENGLSVSSQSQHDDYEEGMDQTPPPPPRTMTLSPKTTKQRPARPAAAVTSSVSGPQKDENGDIAKSFHRNEQDKSSRLARTSQSTGGDDFSLQTAVVREPLLSASAVTAASTASAAAWIAISNSMEEELRALRKKVVLLEAEAKVCQYASPSVSLII